jgi:hypothetical protein
MEMSTLIFITTLLILPLVIPAFALCWLYSKGTQSSLQNNRRYENFIPEL